MQTPNKAIPNWVKARVLHVMAKLQCSLYSLQYTINIITKYPLDLTMFSKTESKTLTELS